MVTYYPDDGFPARAQRLLAQVRFAIVVDNRSGEEARQMLRQWVQAHPSVELIENAENLGIAAALNQGARRAIDRGFSWMLSMDQDSDADASMVEQLLKTYDDCPFRQHVSWIGAQFRCPGDALRREALPDGRFVEVRATNTSGALLSLAAFARVGPFREDYFIDSVDHEYCLRLRGAGYRIVQSVRPLMIHPIGQPVRHKLLGLSCMCLNHSPLRRYYRTRNRLRTVATYWWREPMWSGRELCDIVREGVLIALYEREKIAKIREMLRGFRDGLRGRMPRVRQDPQGRRC